LSAVGLDLLDDVQSLDDFTEDDVLAIEPACHDLHASESHAPCKTKILEGNRGGGRGKYGGDEELRPVGVGPGVGHGEKSGLGVLLGEVLIREFLAVDGLATGPARHVRPIPNKTFRGGRVLSTGEVASLEHELRNDTMEGTACVALPPTSITNPTAAKKEGALRSHVDQCTTHGSSLPSWESHHHTICYTTHQPQSPIDPNCIPEQSGLRYGRGRGGGGTRQRGPRAFRLRRGQSSSLPLRKQKLCMRGIEQRGR
jgi:hypothetical protein